MNSLCNVVCQHRWYSISNYFICARRTNGISFWGSSFIAGPQGEFLYRAPKDEEVVEVVDIDMKRCENVRRWWPFLRDRRIEEFAGLTKRFID